MDILRHIWSRAAPSGRDLACYAAVPMRPGRTCPATRLPAARASRALAAAIAAAIGLVPAQVLGGPSAAVAAPAAAADRPTGAASAAAGPAAPAPAAPATPPAPPPVPGDELSVFVLTMGPGDHPFFKFGHNAIWIQDRLARRDLVYNFGTFRFDSFKAMVPEFVRGRLTYWLSVSTIQQTLATYEAENRTVEAQQLDLDPDEKLALKRRLEGNARPENRAYRYDYFLDNCSTRVRDAIDAATGGRLRASAQGPARMTLRGQALRLTADVVPEYLALDLVLGPSTDRPVDRWAEMFIPEELARGLRAVSVGPAGAPPGAEAGPSRAGARPLVKAQQVLIRARRPPPREQPPERGVTMLLAGLGLSLLLFALGGVGAAQPLARLLFGVLVAAFGLGTGFVGCFLVLVWAATDHKVAYHNENILQCAPFAIALAVLGLGVAFGMRGATRKALVVAGAAAALAIAGAVGRAALIFHQDNARLIAFFVPVWIGITLALYNMRRIQTLR